MRNFGQSSYFLGIFLWLGPSLHAAAPSIFGVAATQVTQTSAAITWTTDVPATSQVVVTTGPGDDFTPLRRSSEDHALTHSHSVTLSQLRPDTTYFVYVVSRDQSGLAGSTQATNINFKTAPAPESGTLDYQLYTAGPTNVFAGSDLHFQITSIRLSGAADHLKFTSINGLPASITPHLLCRAYAVLPGDADCVDSGDGVKFAWLGNDVNRSEPITVRLRTSPDTPPGPYSVTIQTLSGSVAREIRYSFNVQALPATTIQPTPASVPAIPGLAQWESQMLALGSSWCKPAQQFAFGTESQVWYYDGARVYFQIADYTNDARWLPCATNILNQYRDMVISRNGSVQGWRVFPHGLSMNYWRTTDPLSLRAVQLLNSSNPWVITSGSPDPLNIREAAYAVQVMIQHELLTGQRNFHLERAIDYLIGDVDMITGSDPNGFQQTFFNGLVMEALIQYHELTHDPRIPPVVVRLLDWTWANSWDPAQKKLRYNPLDVPSSFSSVTNLLLAPAYAWYWNLTKDPVYLTRGDEMFLHAFDEDVSYSGKIFSQNFRWSFDYVRWRMGGTHSSTHPLANQPSVPKPSLDRMQVQLGPTEAEFLFPGFAGTAFVNLWRQGAATQAGEIHLLHTDTPSFRLTGLLADATYGYTIRLVDQYGNMCAGEGSFRLPLAPAGAEPWHDLSSSHRIPLTIRTTEISSTLSDFPVLLDISTTSLKTVFRGGRVLSEDGSDIRFFDSMGVRLGEQRLSYDPEQGHLVSWVALPKFALDQDVQFFLYAGGSPASSSAPSAWASPYIGVWNLDGMRNQRINDASPSRNDGSVRGSIEFTSGRLGGAVRYYFDPGQWIEIPRSSSMSDPETLTIEAWVRPESTNEGQRIVSNLSGSPTGGYELFIGDGRTSVFGLSIGTSSGLVTATSLEALPLGAWSHVAGTFSGTSFQLYLNGQPVASRTTPGEPRPIAPPSVDVHIGHSAYWPAYASAMTIDEVRIASQARPAEWFAAQYRNLASPLVFVELGPTQLQGPPPQLSRRR